MLSGRLPWGPAGALQSQLAVYFSRKSWIGFTSSLSLAPTGRRHVSRAGITLEWAASTSAELYTSAGADAACPGMGCKPWGHELYNRQLKETWFVLTSGSLAFLFDSVPCFPNLAAFMKWNSETRVTNGAPFYYQMQIQVILSFGPCPSTSP